jgi:predicted O-methyltransferase YrrM
VKKVDVVKFVNWCGYDYKPHVNRYIEIGDQTAIRTLKGTDKTYRRNYERGILLVAIAKHFHLTRFLELGTGRGYSVAALTEFCPTMQRLVTVDRVSCPDAKRLMSDCSVDVSRVEFVDANTSRLRPDQINGKFDFFFIDAEHTGRAVRQDCFFCRQKAKAPYVIVFDDYRKRFRSVKAVIDQMTQFDEMILVHTDSWIIKNECIKKAGDADQIIDEKEHGSGMVVATKGFFFTGL